MKSSVDPKDFDGEESKSAKKEGEKTKSAKKEREKSKSAEKEGLNSNGKKFKSMEDFSLHEEHLMKSSDDPKDFDGEESKSAKKEGDTAKSAKNDVGKTKSATKEGLNIDGEKFKAMKGCSLDERQLMESSDDPKDFDGAKSKSAKKRATLRTPQTKRA